MRKCKHTRVLFRVRNGELNVHNYVLYYTKLQKKGQVCCIFRGALSSMQNIYLHNYMNVNFAKRTKKNKNLIPQHNSRGAYKSLQISIYNEKKKRRVKVYEKLMRKGEG